MLIKQVHLKKIQSGDISVAFRKWNNPRVKKGSLINTSIGQIKIVNVSEINQNKITEKDAWAAGYENYSHLMKELTSRNKGKTYKIILKYHSADPRIGLRENTNLSNEELEQIKLTLERLDKYSKKGNWTEEVLKAIETNPKLRAKDLADKLGKEKDWLKVNIRKLKNLGLTVSHDQGYTLSPRGSKLLRSMSE